MGGSRFRVTVCLVAVAALAAGAGALRAEVSAEPSESEVSVLVLGIIEGPDPIPQIIWEPVRDIDPARYLNPDGAARGDGRPDIASDPVTGWPHVVWAYNNGPDHDIAYSRWTGSAWTPTVFLTSGIANEIDPRIFVDEDCLYVVWWESETQAVRLSQRPRTSSWGPVELIDEPGMRPTVVTWGGTALVALEQAAVDGGTDIVLSTRLGTGHYDSRLVGAVPVSAPLHVVLHTEHGSLWMDWRHSATAFAYSELTGGDWSPRTLVPWIETSWVKRNEVRQTIRSLVLSSP